MGTTIIVEYVPYVWYHVGHVYLKLSAIAVVLATTISRLLQLLLDVRARAHRKRMRIVQQAHAYPVATAAITVHHQPPPVHHVRVGNTYQQVPA